MKPKPKAKHRATKRSAPNPLLQDIRTRVVESFFDAGEWTHSVLIALFHERAEWPATQPHMEVINLAVHLNLPAGAASEFGAVIQGWVRTGYCRLEKRGEENVLVAGLNCDGKPIREVMTPDSDIQSALGDMRARAAARAECVHYREETERLMGEGKTPHEEIMARFAKLQAMRAACP